MAVTEVTRKNWFQRILESIKGILFGGVLVLLAFPVLFWNEGRAVQTARSLSEGAAAVVSVDPDQVSGAHEGALVHLSGEATAHETLSDPTFGISERAIKLRREVEMYQWEERRRTETRRTAGGAEEQVTTYTYDRVWSGRPISSRDFREPGHDNPPSMPYEGRTETAQSVTVGAFTLSPGLVGKIDAWERLPVTGETLGQAAPDLQGRLKPVDSTYYLGDKPSDPQIGDLRVSFSVVRPTVVTAVAQQEGGRLQPYPTLQRGQTIELLEVGRHSADEVFAAAEARNTSLTWILRGVGFGMMLFGLALVGRPISIVADFIPFIGAFFRVGVLFFAGLFASGASLVTIAVAWIVYRPLLGILLLSAGLLAFGALIAGAVTLGRKRKAPAEAEPDPWS